MFIGGNLGFLYDGFGEGFVGVNCHGVFSGSHYIIQSIHTHTEGLGLGFFGFVLCCGLV